MPRNQEGVLVEGRKNLYDSRTLPKRREDFGGREFSPTAGFYCCQSPKCCTNHHFDLAQFLAR